MQKIFKYWLLLIIGAACGLLANAQQASYATTKEKVYLHTNHVFFKPGENMFFKVYVVNAKDQTPSTISSSVFVEVLNPAGNSIQKMSYKLENGYAEGSFDLLESAVGGVYKLKAYTTWMMNEEDSSFFTKEITVQKVIAPRVLMKLDFPKKGYGGGDEVMADFSMRSLDNQPIKNKEGNFAVSLAGKIIGNGKFVTNYQGKAQVLFSLPNDLSTNDGLLNITISHDAYTESISRSIPIALNKIDLQFMPEGGALVAGLATNIAFKALNENGKAADVKGVIIDSKGNEIASFESYHMGMGKFSFKPELGKRYKAKIVSPANIAQQFALPMVQANGVCMNVTSHAEGVVSINIQSTQAIPVKLIGQTKGITYATQYLMLKGGQQAIQLSADSFPTGIAQLTVYAMNEQPLAERLVFMNSNKLLQVKVTTNKEKYQPREKVSMTIQTMDEHGKPLPTNLSLAVVDDKLWQFADDKQDHILSWLLLSSELKGKIEEPQFYFKQDEPKAQQALDLLMMTQGYRYFQFIPYVLQQNKMKYTPDLSTVLAGRIFDVKGKPVKSIVYLMAYNNNGKALKMETDDDGVFCFANVRSGYTYMENYHYLMARAVNSKEGVSIRVEHNGVGFGSFKNKLAKLIDRSNEEEFAAIKPFVAAKPVAEKKETKQSKALEEQLINFGKGTTELNDVVVIGYGGAKRKDLTSSISVVRSSELTTVPQSNLLDALQGRVAGLQVVQEANPGAAAKVTIRGSVSLTGSNEPLIIVDGIPVDKAVLGNLNTGDIASIDVLKDASATAIYGCRAANGVIVITSSKSNRGRLLITFGKQDKYFNILPVNAVGPNYFVARKFYAPIYKTLETEERTDFRETIYWNPVVQTDKNGAAKLEFYNSDATTTFRAVAEGIAYNGKLGRAEATYAVENAITVDAKVPPYLTVGDKALIPLNIKNNTSDSVELNIEVDSIDDATIGNFNGHLFLAPGKALQTLVPLEARKAITGNIRFTVNSQLGSETLVLPITASNKGFAVTETFAGSSSASHSFSIRKMVPHTLKTDLRLFTSVEGHLLEGIESMLREPYGCFEQTSSTTYPNVFVLKYLKESNKLNPEVEKKALGYIERGYKRLIGFETKEDGFEWFGRSPANEALTAYGLLEFTDMQEFIHVDKKMLERTKKFLLNKRDGNGAFKFSYGFGSVPSTVVNQYIVYALTQAGMGHEIQREYDTAVQRAIASKDGYLLGLMAIAASNMKNTKDFTRLMQLLDEGYKKDGLAAATSITYSRYSSLKVETLALYVLALAREENPRLALMAGLLDKIINEKSYYGYGSTQGTVLALNAVVTYTKLTGKVISEEKEPIVRFMLNGKEAISSVNAAESIVTTGTNSFAVEYGKGNRAIPYQLQVSYSTFTPPNSAKAELNIATSLSSSQAKIGETVRMEIAVSNNKDAVQPMAIAKLGIPAGLAAQPWQLKEIMEKNQVAYYEIFDNYLVLYWMGFAAKETKQINLDLKAEVPGNYKGKASNAYLYYTPEFKHWNDGLEISIEP